MYFSLDKYYINTLRKVMKLNSHIKANLLTESTQFVANLSGVAQLTC